MRRFVCIALILMMISGLAGCARARRIANDVDWIVFDAQPSREN